jgi:hypothetical protein
MTATPPNVRRVTGSANPDDRNYTGLGYVDRHGTYHFPDGRRLPATGGILYPGEGDHRSGGGQRLVVSEDATTGTPPTPDAADLHGSGLQWLHAVDRAQQDAYDVAEFGVTGGDPVPVSFSEGTAGLLPPEQGHGDPHAADAFAHEVDSPAWESAVTGSRRDHPERHAPLDPHATTKEN